MHAGAQEQITARERLASISFRPADEQHPQQRPSRWPSRQQAWPGIDVSAAIKLEQQQIRANAALVAASSHFRAGATEGVRVEASATESGTVNRLDAADVDGFEASAKRARQSGSGTQSSRAAEQSSDTASLDSPHLGLPSVTASRDSVLLVSTASDAAAADESAFVPPAQDREASGATSSPPAQQRAASSPRSREGATGAQAASEGFERRQDSQGTAGAHVALGHLPLSAEVARGAQAAGESTEGHHKGAAGSQEHLSPYLEAARGAQAARADVLPHHLHAAAALGSLRAPAP